MNDDLASPLTGQRAPDFTLPRTNYASFALRDVLGRPAVLVFYPGDWEPISSGQLRLYEEHLSDFRRFDAALVAISVDNIWSHAAYSKALDLRFPLLSDFNPKGSVARAYQVYSDREGRSGRALFVLDPTGSVRWGRRYPTNLNPGIHGILSALEALEVTRAPPVNDTMTTDINH